jgi:DNA invertase Pin-like site-specific DNA recombinase
MKKSTKATFVPARIKMESQEPARRQLRVAVYYLTPDRNEQVLCDECLWSYYAEKISANESWTLAGIFTDRGSSVSPAEERPAFAKMFDLCKQEQIDIVITASLSRFARNAMDCIDSVRKLQDLGVGVVFEKERLSSLDGSVRPFLTMWDALARAETD